MNRIPVIFSIDNNVVVQCGVTISSLLINAKPETQYDIYILYDEQGLAEYERERLVDAFRGWPAARISFVNVNDLLLDSSSVFGHVTAATYYRLVIPELFPQYNRVIYSDIDIIFQQDLSELFADSLQNDELVAAVLDLAIDNKHFFQSSLPGQIGKSEKDYFNAGFLVMNLKRMREEKIVDAFREHSGKGYAQNDQDVLNVVCNGRVQLLPSKYNFQLNHFSNYMWGRQNPELQFGELFKTATLHYTWKNKPWNSLECIAADTWWHYYKLSPFYDDKVYFKRQQDQIEASRNDYHRKTNKQLFLRILVNIKHKLFK